MRAILLTILMCAALGDCDSPEQTLEAVAVSADGSHFVRGAAQEPIRFWGVNYDHDRSRRLIEEYWYFEWATVVEDFEEIKALGANVVRIHLQVGAFMKSAEEPRQVALDRLARLVRLAEDTGLYLDITGLGCYDKEAVPEWYSSAEEEERWAVQVRFWEAVAETCAGSPAIFCYDLMNEPILPGEAVETDWLAGDFAGRYFVQRIALDLAGRSQKEVAKAWVDMLAEAIQKHDTHHLITVGAIPWAHSFPGAKPLFYSEEVRENLDFVSVHFYPKADGVDAALEALAVYDIGLPIVIEEMFPLECGMEQMDTFIEGARDIAEGYMSFYWGETIEEYGEEVDDLSAAILKAWLEYFRDKASSMLACRKVVRDS